MNFLGRKWFFTVVFVVAFLGFWYGGGNTLIQDFMISVYSLLGFDISGGATFQDIFDQLKNDRQLQAIEGRDLFVVVAGLALLTFISEDLASILSGLIASTGALTFFWATTAAFSGILIGDSIIFLLGYVYGRDLLRHPLVARVFNPALVERGRLAFQRYGLWIIIITRFIPGTRSVTYFAAGSVGASPMRFIGVFALASLIWTPVIVGISYHVGNRIILYYDRYAIEGPWTFIFASLLLYFLLHNGMQLTSWKGRRKLKARMLRKVKWEFWPSWLIYPPLFVYAASLAIFRYKKLMVCTVTNPAMPHSGFLGESKSEILTGLGKSSSHVAQWAKIGLESTERRMEYLHAWMESNDLVWPIVIKPDEGQRGLAVTIARNEERARNAIESLDCPMIVQSYIGGMEYGVFYYKYPGSEKGKIFSITRKLQVSVEGDGKHTIEELILKHSRAVLSYKVYLARFEDRLDEVLHEGESLKLGELGTHARGALFLDGSDLLTNELSATIDDIVRPYKGFYFGRFDIKAKNDEAFSRGENLSVLELNGITSEATHMYDPQYGIFYAWKTLFQQWRIAHEIAFMNYRRGAMPSSIGNFLKDLISAQSRQKQYE